MKTKILGKFINKVIWKNKFKIFTISVILALAMSIFLTFNISNSNLEKVANNINQKHKKFDFKFNLEPKLQPNKLATIARKYGFNYEIKQQKEVETILDNKTTSVVSFNDKGSQLVNILIRPNSKKDQLASSYLTTGHWNKNGEVLVTKQYLQTTGKRLNDVVKIGQKKFKIVGTFGTPEYLKKIRSFVTDRSAQTLPVEVTKNDFKQIKAPTQKIVFANFKQVLTYEQKSNIYNTMKKDSNFVKTEKIPQYKIKVEKITYNPNNLCGDKQQFDDYSKLETLTQKQFDVIKQVALQAQNGGSCRQTLDVAASATSNPTLTQASLQTASLQNATLANTNIARQNATNSYVAGTYQPSATLTNQIQTIVNTVVALESKQYDMIMHHHPSSQYFQDLDKTQYKPYESLNSILQQLEANTLPDKYVQTYVGAVLKTGGINKLIIQGGHVVADFSAIKIAYAADKKAFAQEEKVKQDLALKNQKIEQSKLDAQVAAKKAQLEAQNEAKKAQVAAINAKTKQEVAQANERAKKAAEEANNKAKNLVLQQKQKAAKEAQKLKNEQLQKDNDQVEKTFKIKTFKNFKYKNYSLLASIIDANDNETSNALKIQIEQQNMLSWMLFIIFILLAALLIIIVLQKIINDNRSEIGVLKAMGIKANKITFKFLKVPFITLIIAIFLSLPLTYFATLKLQDFVYSILYLPQIKFNWINPITIMLALIVPLVILMLYVFISLKSILGTKTLKLLNNIKSNKSYSNLSFMKKLSTNAKLTLSTILNNASKTLTIVTIGFIVTMLISLTSLMYFSAVETFSSIGGELSYSSINVNKVNERLQPADKLQAYVKMAKISRVVDKYDNEIKNENAKYRINESNELSLSILAPSALKSEGYDLSQYKNSMNKGLVLPAKYASLYHLKVGDKFVIQRKTPIYLTISAFQNHDENIFAYTSIAYLSSQYNELGKANASIAPTTNSFTKKLDYVINKDQAASLLNEKLNQIVIIVIVMAIIILLIVIPLIFILIANIIDSNISTIATLKALGFSIGKIRGIIINPYLIVFILGQILALIFNQSYLGPKFSTIFFGYLGYDVVFHEQINAMVITLILIVLFYQMVIILSSQRINIIKTARILNDDNAVGKITNSDVFEYLKLQVRASIDFDKPIQSFNYKVIENLNKTEKKSLNKKARKIFTPKIIEIIISNLSNIPVTSLQVVTSVIYKAYYAILIPINGVNNAITQINVVETILGSSDVFLIQYAKAKKVAEFQDIAYLKSRIHILYAIVKLLIAWLLSDTIAMLIGLNSYQKSLLPYVLIGTTIVNLATTLFARGIEYERHLLNYKPSLIVETLSKITSILSIVVLIFMSAFIKQDIRLYIVIPYFISLIFAIVKFILSYFICRNNEFTNIKIHKIFKKFTTQAPQEVIKASLPSFRVNLINIPVNFLVTIVGARILNSIVLANQDYVVYQSIVAVIISIAAAFDFTILFDTYTALANQKMANSKFIEAIKLYKYNRKIIFKWTPLMKLIPYVGSAFVLSRFKFDLTTTLYIVLGWIGEYLGYVLNRFIQSESDLLNIGGEFKFSAYISGFIAMVTRPLQLWGFTIVLFLNLPIYWISIIVIIQVIVTYFIQILIFSYRIKQGRWMYNISAKEYIYQNKIEYKKYLNLWNK